MAVTFLTNKDKDELDQTIEELSDDTTKALTRKVDGAYVTTNGYLVLTANGVSIGEPLGPFSGGAGGGGGSSASTTVTLTNQNGTATLASAYGSELELLFNFTSLQGEIPTGNGNLKLYVNDVLKLNKSVPQGPNSLDVSPYLAVGSNTVRLICTDVYGNYAPLIYDITTIKLTIESLFDSSVPYTSGITLKYTPYGSIDKVVHFVVDGVEVDSVATSVSGRQLTKVFSAMSHGAHTLEVYSTAMMGDVELESNHLRYEIPSIRDGVTTPVIASMYDVAKVNQGEQVSIPYIVYDPTALNCDITLTVYTMADGRQVYSTQNITVDRTQKYWNTRKYPLGEVYFEISYGDIKKTHSLTVEESDISVEAEDNDLELVLMSDGRSNDEANPGVWSYGDVETTFTGMNWSSVGWMADENGDTCLRLNGDARAEISFKPFDKDLRQYGKTIELDFAIRDVNNRDAVVMSCMSGGLGFEVKADTAYIASEQSRVFCNYKDEERVRLAFVIESRSEHRLLSIYLNGILSDIIQYPTTDNFQQTTPVNISVGTSDCGVDIYAIRSYSTALSSEVVTNNFIADMADLGRKTEVAENNDIYDEYGAISFSKAKEKNSVMVLIGDLPQSKGDKKEGKAIYYDVNNSALNFEDEMEIDVQGTSSQYYVRKNWKLKFKNKHQIDADQIDTRVICLKVDYAEATGTHNTQNANFVHTLYSEKVPPQVYDERVRTTIYGKPILLFHQADDTSEPVFYGKANFNFDKGSEEAFGFTPEWDVECWEFCNNTSNACNFLGRIPSVWKDDFEARYPDGSTDMSRFKTMHDWVVSTKGNVEKFRNEFENYFDLHFSLIYYVYTFVALMVDQRAKNMFLTYWGKTGKWYPYFYDNDTCFGINNEGQLVFDYYHEDTDQVGGANVYNGQNSTLWCNFREAFADEIKETYQKLRSDKKLTFEAMEERFIRQGSDKWSESIYNEDTEFKYVSMLKSDNDATNLPQVRGSGEEHLRYFIQNRLNYCDSKYYASAYADDYIALRIYTPATWSGVEPNADITITPFSNMYAGVRYKANGTLYQERAEHGEPVTFNAPDETFNDTETAVYGASQISSLGDLAPLYAGSVNVSKATKLISLKVGDGTEGYVNDNLKELSVGTNRLLKSIDIQNCPSFTSALALSGCPNIEEIYAKGSGITGVELPDSGYLKTIQLPAVSNLTLKNQIYIEDLTLEGYDNISTLVIENCPTLDKLDLLNKSVNVQRVRLTKVDWSLYSADMLMRLVDSGVKGIDENGLNVDVPQITGKCHIAELTGDDMSAIREYFPYLEITYDTLTATIVYMNEDGTVELYRERILNGGDSIYDGDDPVKESTAQYHFTHSGWSYEIGGEADPNATKHVETNRVVYAVFGEELRSYTVTFSMDGAVLQSSVLPYGSMPEYTGTEPTKTDYKFNGWNPSLAPVTGDVDYVANMKSSKSMTRMLLEKNLESYSSNTLSSIGQFAFYKCSKLNAVILRSETMVTLVNTNAFQASAVASGTGYIYVPRALVDTYKSASNWSTYANQFRTIEDYPEICG